MSSSSRRHVRVNVHVLPQYEKIELMTKKPAGLIFEDERFEIHWLENHVIHPPLTPLTELSRENVRKVSYVPSPSQRDRIEKIVNFSVWPRDELR